MKKILTLMLASVLLMGTFSTTAMAKSVTETEPNDTFETAEEIMTNRQTAQEYLNANNTNSYVVKGSVSKTDQDWFKIYLNSTQDKYFSIYSKILYFQIFDSNKNPVTEQFHVTDATRDYQVFDFSYLPAGNYYIQLIGTGYSDSYQFLFGNPVYEMDSVTRQGGRISLSSTNREEEDTIDFGSATFPDGAQVDMISINGVLSSYASEVGVSYSESTHTFLESYSSAWDLLKVPLSYNYGLNGEYTFTYTYKNDRTFTPSYKFYYVYPLLP